MKLSKLKAVAVAGMVATGLAAAAVSQAAPGHQGPGAFKVLKAKTAVLICNPHKIRNYLIVYNHNSKTFPKGSKIFYLAQKPGGGIVAQGWYTLKWPLKAGRSVRIKYGSWPLPRTRKATYCRTYIKYYG